MPAPRNIVKFVKDVTITAVASQAMESAIHLVVDETTESQDTGIRIASLLIGLDVAGRVQDRTDTMIDAVADWRKNRKLAETPPAV